MSTIYTEIVAQRDDCSLKDFALRCAREFGALACMRDEPIDAPIPVCFESDDFYQKKYEAAKAEHDAFIANPPTREELSKEYDEYVASQKEEYAKAMADKREKRRRYNRMLTKVLNWAPPTPEHQELRRFMIQQLQESIDLDCTEYDLALPSKTAYIARRTDEELMSICIENYSIKWRKELRINQERNQWLQALRESLKE